MGLSEDARFNLIVLWLPLLNIAFIPLVLMGSAWFLVPQVLVLLFQLALFWEWV
jgi:hypothetical protein